MAIVNAVEVMPVTVQKPSSDATVINVILDETGSMNVCWDSTISSFNDYIGGQKTSQNARCDVSLTTFSTSGMHFGAASNYQSSKQDVRDVFRNHAVQDVPVLTKSTYKPNGGTNLYDAIGSTIRRLESEMANRSDAPAVLVVIITDGEENSSREYNLSSVKALMQQKEQDGWTFIYLGANQDAWRVGATMGLSRGQTMTYSTASMDSTMNTLSAATTRYRSIRSTEYAAGATTASVRKDFFDGGNNA